MNKLTEVDQGGQLRKYKYDALGRLLFEKIPEQTASINDGTGTYWTSKYTYTDYNKISTRTDARGVVTTYSYDSLHRPTQVSYNTVSGVTTAPSVFYQYDYESTYNITNQGQLVRVYLSDPSLGVVYQEFYTVDSYKRPASTIRKMPGTYTTSYSLNEAGQLTQLAHPSGLDIAVTHDSSGRLSGLKNVSTQVNYLSSVTYNIAGMVTGGTLGNGVTEQYGYDAARMQLTSQKAGTSSPYTNRMDLTYSYSASSGQMGVGSTAGNSEQLMSISGTINATTESATYTYDNYGRLTTSNQTSNGTSAQRRFAYDRWGNRTGVWDATSGGNQIQSISLQQTNSIPCNRISSVTTTSTVNFTYDAVGNVTDDGVHSYTYDGENRIVRVDSGTTATYAYDHQNRRYKTTVGSTVTHYLWEGGQVLAEHNGGTGAVLIDYVRAGIRMVSKVFSGGTTEYLLSDRLSTRLVLNTSGAVLGRQGHLPFGERVGESGTQEKHRLTSYERDSESSTDYAVNRQHSSEVGRFMSADPYKQSGFLVNPQTWNRYTYVQSDPVNFTDATGLFANPALYWLLRPVDVVVITHPDLGTTPPPPTGEAKGSGAGSVPKEVEKHYTFRMPCKKDGLTVSDELKSSFTQLADYSALIPGWISFEDKPIREGARIQISAHLNTLPPPFNNITKTFHVGVSDVQPNGWTFTTESDHVFYPGTISFSIVETGNREIELRIDLKGKTNGFSGTAGFFFGGESLEDNTWQHLARQVRKKICGT